MEWCLSGRKELTANELRATPPQVRILSTPRDPFQMDKCSSRLCTACWGSGQRAWSQHDCFVLAHGLVAPMVERLVRIEEAACSNHVRSTWSLVGLRRRLKPRCPVVVRSCCGVVVWSDKRGVDPSPVKPRWKHGIAQRRIVAAGDPLSFA